METGEPGTGNGNMRNSQLKKESNTVRGISRYRWVDAEQR